MQLIRLLSSTLVLAILAGCAGQTAASRPDNPRVPMLPQAFDISDVGPEQVVLVGRIELTPNLKKHDQSIPEAYQAQYVKQAYSFFSSDPDEPAYTWQPDSRHGSSVRAPIGEFFFPLVERKPQHYRFSRVYLNRQRQPERINLPGNAEINVTEKMKFVYIGTLRYTRDDFGVVTKVKTINEYSKALAATRKRFGKGIKLHKQLVRIYLN